MLQEILYTALYRTVGLVDFLVSMNYAGMSGTDASEPNFTGKRAQETLPSKLIGLSVALSYQKS
jgi:hypothetical protein